MIKFTRCRWKNFMSYGDTWTEIDFDGHGTTVVVGENGAGKSTFIDAICFGLFGKSFRRINKDQLVNSINKRGCLVEVDFSVGSNKYTIRRGIKPKVFDIIVNGSVKEQDSRSLDHQKFLEKYILKFDIDAFRQVVVLGRSTFTPFMQLSAAGRRSIIEDILDIGTFSTMSEILKGKIIEVNGRIMEINKSIESLNNSISIHETYLKSIQEKTAEGTADKKVELEHELKNLSQLKNDLGVISDEMSKTSIPDSDINDIQDNLNKMLSYKHKIEANLSMSIKNIEFFNENDSCPVCLQYIDDEFKSTVIEKNVNDKNKFEDGLKKLENEIRSIQTKLDAANRHLLAFRDLQVKYTNTSMAIEHTEKYVNNIKTSIENSSSSSVEEIASISKKIEDCRDQISTLQSSLSDILIEKHYMDIAVELLKDNGIKSSIIRQYIPIINQLVNLYLQDMDFFVQFNLDESFNETIKSRHRDTFSYNSFSDGEKQRIDLALLFTWRYIAKLRNSASTNLLILDEVFDSSLDSGAIDAVMNMIKRTSEDHGTNVIIISHRSEESFGDKFESQIFVKKERNFSVMNRQSV